MVKLVRLRIGHATSSSSTHSVVIVPGKVKQVPDVDNGGFQWESFVLVDKDLKADYVRAQFYDAMRRDGLSPRQARKEVERVLGPFVLEYADDYIVDHQSLWKIPTDRQQADQYIQELFRGIVDDKHVVILGGNDNDEDPPHIKEIKANSKTMEIPLRTHLCRGVQIVGKRIPHGWALFDKEDGTIVEFAAEFSHHEDANNVQLVDFLITNKCDRSCRFCYTNSGPDGEHGHPDAINEALKAIRELAPFEVVIGGGEPTLHPSFPAIAEALFGAGISVSFTTRSLVWLRNDAMREAVQEYCSAIGFSCESLHEAQHFTSRIKTGLGKKTPMLAAHVILGIVPVREIVEISKHMASIDGRIVLLGYKRIGRGAEHPVFSPSKSDMKQLWRELHEADMKQLWRELHGPIGADSAAVAIIERYIDPLPYYWDLLATRKEGVNSMCIKLAGDTRLVGASSTWPRSFRPWKTADDIVHWAMRRYGYRSGK
jgi:MoaA/NifB/PqqE/SkfB family radical SAM enzyme